MPDSAPTFWDRPLGSSLRLLPWAALTTVSAFAWTFWGPLNVWADRVLATLLCLLSTVLVLRAVTLFVWEPYRRRRHLVKLPSLMKQGVQLVVTAVVFVSVLSGVWQVSITGLLAATGVVGIVVGLALKELISDLFSGVIIAIDRTVKIGDFLRIENRNFEEKRGTVVEMNWRTVRLVTPENVLVVIPNTYVANNVISNLSEPADAKEFEFTLVFDVEIPSERVLRVLDAALASTPQVPQEPAPKVRLSRVLPHGVEYKVLFYLDAGGPEPGKVRHFALTHVLHHLSQAGLSPSYPKQDVFTAERPVRNLDTRAHRADLVARIPLFAELSRDELGALAAGLVEHRAPRGTGLVKAGDRGESLFLLVEGLLEVFLPTAEGDDRVDELPPGSYFGEMSLMTGEPRSATVKAARDSVVYEVPRESMEALLRTYPALVDQLSAKIAELHSRHEAFFQTKAEANTDQRELTSRLRQKIAAFFRLW